MPRTKTRIVPQMDMPNFEAITPNSTVSQVVRALSWVGAEVDNKTLAKEANKLAADHSLDVSVVPDDFLIVPGKFAFCLHRGATFQDSVRSRNIETLKKLISQFEAKNDNQDDSNAHATVKKTATETIKENTGTLIAILDNWIDGYNTSLEDSMRGPYEIIRGFVASSGVNTSSLLEYFYEAHESLVDFGKEATPEELDSYGGKRPFNTLIKKYATVLSDIEAFAQTKKAARKPRKTKEKPVHKKIEKVTYRKEEPSLKIVSLTPDKVIGKSEAWLYNTHYRKIIHLVAENEKTLDIKGTTIQNIDLETSDCKMVRKPETVFPEFVGLGKVDTRRVYGSIKTKPQSTSGRLSDQVLILKVG